MCTLPSIFDPPLIDSLNLKGDFSMFTIKKTCDVSRTFARNCGLVSQQHSVKRKRAVAFGSAIRQQMTKSPQASPFLCYDVNYSGIDPHQKSVSFQLKRMHRSITESSNIGEPSAPQLSPSKKEDAPTLRRVCPRIEYPRPPSYLKVSRFQPMTSAELSNCLDQLKHKHGVKFPSLVNR